MPRKNSKAFLSAARRGSILIVVGGILFVLLLFAGGFFKFMMAQNRQSHRLTEQRYTSIAAQALATLAVHKLRLGMLRDLDSDLAKWLSKPISSSGNLDDFNLPALDLRSGTPDFGPVVDEITKPLLEQGQFSFTIAVKCLGKDYVQMGLSKYPREKRGYLRLIVTTTHKKLGESGTPVPEEFQFLARMKVTAALFPVLSKFSLYVEDALDGEPPFRFNQVSTDLHGELTPNTTHQPWVFDHGDKKLIPRLTDLVKSSRGLVYLGGGPVFLNVARGWKPEGRFSEEFHLYQGSAGDGDGLSTHALLGGAQDIALMNWEQGMCDDVTSQGANDWWEFIRQSPRAAIHHARRNSIFRLYGVGQGQSQSPTLVLGEVFRNTICARAYKALPSGNLAPRFSPNFLPFINKDHNFQEYVDMLRQNPVDDDTPTIAPFAREMLLTPTRAGLERYITEFASNLRNTPYNATLGFMLTNNRNAAPWSSLSADPLRKYAENSLAVPDPDVAHGIPAPFQVLDGVNSLTRMADFFDGLGISGQAGGADRAAWVIDTAAEPDIWKALTRRGLLIGQKLDLNGWVFIKGKTEIKFTQNLELLSNGGLVLEQGDITISRAIDGKSDHVLQVVARGGDIVVDFSGQVDAALVAKGKVLVKNAKPVITGAVAMGKFELANAVQGAEVKYFPALSALPEENSDETSERNLLSFSIEPTPVLVQ